MVISPRWCANEHRLARLRAKKSGDATHIAYCGPVPFAERLSVVRGGAWLCRCASVQNRASARLDGRGYTKTCLRLHRKVTNSDMLRFLRLLLSLERQAQQDNDRCQPQPKSGQVQHDPPLHAVDDVVIFCVHNPSPLYLIRRCDQRKVRSPRHHILGYDRLAYHRLDDKRRSDAS